jgi:ABC-type ATPase with predicted acetyltransferase domain
VPNKLITWKWETHVQVFVRSELPPAFWPERKTADLTLHLNTKRGKRSLCRVSYTTGEREWRVLAPRDFDAAPIDEVSCKEAMEMVRDLVANLVSEEFAGVE